MNEETELDRWVATLGVHYGTGAVDVPAILDVAAEAAHTIIRPAAPVTTFLAGLAAGLNGGSPEAIAEALATAKVACAQASS